MEKSELYKKARELWGVSSQIDMAVEECCELVVAISHWKRGRAGDGKVAEEIADVEIMCEQLRCLLPNEEIDAWKEAKLTRLEERINNCN
jgi:NTP pyrophosphatase (non-canonical NTP hydrolase)